MAKLHSYYVLCPLIDQKSFLGVSEDKQNDHVIVTLGRNIVNTYRLSDQKQIGGWTSKDHITSVVIYDKEYDSYIGVFNNNIIKMWKEDAQNLGKAKKYKFELAILRILYRKNQSSLIILVNGNCVSLTYGLDNRKSLEGKSLLKSTDNIVDMDSYTHNGIDYICYIIKNAQDKFEIASCPLRNEIGDLEKAKFSKIRISRNENDVTVVGKMICTKNKYVYVLWSDSKITSYDLINKNWKVISSVPWISTSSNVSLAWMGENHLIMFGSDSNEDGAILVAYNVMLGVGSHRYPMKMYFDNAKLYCFNNRIILEAGNHLGMLPYTLEVTRNLSNLLASHEVAEDDTVEFADWGYGEVSLSVSDDIKQLLNMGLSERAICTQIIPTFLEKNDFKNLQKAMNQFSDVPESVIVMLLEYIANKLRKNESTDKDLFRQFSTKTNREKLVFLNNILRIPLSDALIIPHLRNGLTLENAVVLLNYIVYVLLMPDCTADLDFESKLFDWCALLLDAFYQQYLMSKDVNVTNTLENLRRVIVELTRQLEYTSDLLPILHKVISNKTDVEEEEFLTYTIEMINI